MSLYGTLRFALTLALAWACVAQMLHTMRFSSYRILYWFSRVYFLWIVYVCQSGVWLYFFVASRRESMGRLLGTSASSEWYTVAGDLASRREFMRRPLDVYYAD